MPGETDPRNQREMRPRPTESTWLPTSAWDTIVPPETTLSRAAALGDAAREGAIQAKEAVVHDAVWELEETAGRMVDARAVSGVVSSTA